MWPPRTRNSGGKGEQHNDNGRAGDIACPHFSSPGLRIPYPRKRLLKFARPVQRGRSYSSSGCRIDNPEWECFDFGRRTRAPRESRHAFKPSRPLRRNPDRTGQADGAPRPTSILLICLRASPPLCRHHGYVHTATRRTIHPSPSTQSFLRTLAQAACSSRPDSTDCAVAGSLAGAVARAPTLAWAKPGAGSASEKASAKAANPSVIVPDFMVMLQ